MKFGFRIPSLKKRIAARTSLKRVVRHSMGLKAPRGMGIITNPKRALYNKIYNKTSISIDSFGGRPAHRKTRENNGIEWSTGNFKTHDELLAKAKEKEIQTNGQFLCQRCGSDIWAIAHMKFLFLEGDASFCQVCGKPGPAAKKLKIN